MKYKNEILKIEHKMTRFSNRVPEIAKKNRSWVTTEQHAFGNYNSYADTDTEIKKLSKQCIRETNE